MATVYKQGYLTKQGSWVKSWKRRYFYLSTDGKFRYFATPLAPTPLGEVHLLNASVTYAAPIKVQRQYALEVTTAGRTLLVCADNQTECKAWAVALTKVSISVTKKIPIAQVRDPADGAAAGAAAAPAEEIGGGAPVAAAAPVVAQPVAGAAAAVAAADGGGDQKKVSEPKVIHVPHAEVKLAVTDALPAGWRMGQDKTGRMFFVNDVAKKTQWDDPRPLPAYWLLQREPQTGRIYFANSATKKTQWNDPRPPLFFPGSTPPNAHNPMLGAVNNFAQPQMAMAMPVGAANGAGYNPMLMNMNPINNPAMNNPMGAAGAIVSPFAADAAAAAAAGGADVKQRAISLDKQQVEGVAGSGASVVPAVAPLVEPEEGCGPEGKVAPPSDDGGHASARRPTKAFDLEWYKDILTICVAARSITPEEHTLLVHVRTKYAISETEHLKMLKDVGLSEADFDLLRKRGENQSQNSTNTDGTSATATAAAAAANGSPVADAKHVEGAPPKSTTSVGGECVVCLEPASANHIILPCMHLCLCEACALKYQEQQTPNCPKCRSVIARIAKTF